MGRVRCRRGSGSTTPSGYSAAARSRPSGLPTTSASTVTSRSKVLADNWARDEDVRRRFLDEARVLWRLDSDRAIRVHAVDELEDGRPYFVMDYADRGSLADKMKQRAEAGERYSEEEALAVSLDIADALAVVHRLGIVHRDLKPSNVLYRTVASHHGDTRAERMVLADFGVSRALDAATAFTIAAGTPHYMAPEQMEGRADERSDVYAAAVVLYELLAGRVPYPYESVGAVMRAQLSETPAPISSLRDDISPALDAVLARGLASDPNDRYGSASEWADALRGVEGMVAVGTLEGEGDRATADTVIRPAGAAAAAAAGGAGVAAAASSGGGAAGPPTAPTPAAPGGAGPPPSNGVEAAPQPAHRRAADHHLPRRRRRRRRGALVGRRGRSRRDLPRPARRDERRQQRAVHRAEHRPERRRAEDPGHEPGRGPAAPGRRRRHAVGRRRRTRSLRRHPRLVGVRPRHVGVVPERECRQGEGVGRDHRHPRVADPELREQPHERAAARRHACDQPRIRQRRCHRGAVGARSGLRGARRQVRCAEGEVLLRQPAARSGAGAVEAHVHRYAVADVRADGGPGGTARAAAGHRHRPRRREHGPAVRSPRRDRRRQRRERDAAAARWRDVVDDDATAVDHDDARRRRPPRRAAGTRTPRSG